MGYIKFREHVVLDNRTFYTMAKHSIKAYLTSKLPLIKCFELCGQIGLGLLTRSEANLWWAVNVNGYSMYASSETRYIPNQPIIKHEGESHLCSTFPFCSEREKKETFQYEAKPCLYFIYSKSLGYTTIKRTFWPTMKRVGQWTYILVGKTGKWQLITNEILFFLCLVMHTVSFLAKIMIILLRFWRFWGDSPTWVPMAIIKARMAKCRGNWNILVNLSV